LPFSLAERFILWSIGTALLLELAASLAPLTGSDALHYHFTTEQLILEQGFHPIFFLTHSFLCGQGHLLILLGLALGSESLAMSFLFLGGALAALAVACLAARWVPRPYAIVFALLFLLTPLVFWQISASGSPDIWMAAFTGAAVLVILRTREDATARHALLAGFLAGGVAGAKYTGCVIAMAVAIAFLVEDRSARKGFLFFLGALFSGIWPFARNLIWTGDPVFPILASRLFPERINAYAIGDLLADTGAASSHSLFQVIPFLFFSMRAAGAAPGFWEFFGPIVLALAPLVFLACRNTREWRMRILVWLSAGLGIFPASGSTRFLLPLLPIAFSCVAAGVYRASQKGWVQIHRLATLSILLACFMGAVGLPLYTAPAIFATIGVEDRQHYLREKAPDYQIAQAVNESLSSAPTGGKTLVFIRHLYYLRVPYVLGDPSTSWQVNPAFIRTAADWRAFLHDEQIAYVVRSPSYPATIAAPLEQLEKEGSLILYSKKEVQNFQGMRIAGRREPVVVVILRVVPDVSPPLRRTK
jgi:4-amino-4-deoxy-L-arabinose transferase-like glycosyltransferase